MIFQDFRTTLFRECKTPKKKKKNKLCTWNVLKRLPDISLDTNNTNYIPFLR